ncbi:hypothetical protein CAEBREN_13208 [Caenorhabditis brenneri]|uniref:Uncharacterized protein n=1 Tax=Caenorhabditis brenneri TaxID=135651 RepID=G0M899_CAEBE|nr:hypothetical protein CAEBREN_13208 [Caenorhabditis brenneri]
MKEGPVEETREATVGKMQEAPSEEMREAPVEEMERMPIQNYSNEYTISDYIDSSHLVRTRLANREQLRLSNFPAALAASLPVLKVLESERGDLESENGTTKPKRGTSKSKNGTKEAEKKCRIVFKVPKPKCPNCSFKSEKLEEVAKHIIKTYSTKEDYKIWEITTLVPKEIQKLIDETSEEQQKSAYITIKIENCTKVLQVPVTCPVFPYLAKTGVEVSTTKEGKRHYTEADIMGAGEQFKIFFIFDAVAEHQKEVHNEEALKQALVLKEEVDDMETVLQNTFNSERRAAVAAYLKVSPETESVMAAVRNAPICQYGDEIYNCPLKQQQAKEELRREKRKAEAKAEKDKAEFIKKAKAEEEDRKK